MSSCLYLVDGAWSAWADEGDSSGQCSVTCGDGVKTQTRQCNDFIGVGGCDGDETQQITCNLQACPGGRCTCDGIDPQQLDPAISCRIGCTYGPRDCPKTVSLKNPVFE